MTQMTHINGKNTGAIRLYALSTCIWCKKTKKLLDKLGVAYDYVFVDLLSGEEKQQVMDEIYKWNPRGSFPTMVIDQDCIVGFKEEKIRERLSV